MSAVNANAREVINLSPGQREVIACINMMATTLEHHFGIQGLVSIQVTEDAGLRLGIAPGMNMVVATGSGSVLVEAVKAQPPLLAIKETPTQTAAYAEAVVAEINRLTGRQFRTTEFTTKWARALIKARFPVETAVAVVRFKFNQWKDKPGMVEYVQPSTLMPIGKMKRYRDEMEAGPARAGATTTFSTFGEP